MEKLAVLRSRLATQQGNLLRSLTQYSGEACNDARQALQEAESQAKALLSSVRRTAGPCRMGELDHQHVFSKELSQNSSDANRKIAEFLESAISFIESGSSLISEMVKAPDDLMDIETVMRSYKDHMKHYAELCGKYQGFPETRAVASQMLELKACARDFSHHLYTVIGQSVSAFLQQALSRRPELSKLETHFGASDLLTLLYEAQAPIDFIWEHNFPSFQMLLGLVVIALKMCLQRGMKFLETELPTFILDPPAELLNVLQMKQLSLPYAKQMYANQQPVGSTQESNVSKSGPGAAFGLGSEIDMENPPADVVYGWFLLSILDFASACEEDLDRVFFAGVGGVEERRRLERASERDTTSDNRSGGGSSRRSPDFRKACPLDPVFTQFVNTAMSATPSALPLLLAKPDAKEYLQDLNSIESVLATVFSGLLRPSDFSHYAVEVQSCVAASGLSGETLKQTVALLVDSSRLQNDDSLELFGYGTYCDALAKLLDTNILFSLPLLAELEAAINICSRLMAQANADGDQSGNAPRIAPVICYLAYLPATFKCVSVIEYYQATYEASLSSLQYCIKQAGIFSGTIYLANAVSAMFAFYCDGAYMAASLGKQNTSYRRTLHRLETGEDRIDEDADPSVLSPFLEEFVLTFDLASSIPAIESAIRCPYERFYTITKNFLSTVVQLDKANCEKYAGFATMENFHFFYYLTKDLYKQNFQDTLFVQMESELRGYVSSYVLSNLQYKIQDPLLTIHDRIVSVLSEGFRPSDFPTRPGLGLREMEGCVRWINRDTDKGLNEVIERVIKHLKGRFSNSNVISVTTNVMKEACADLCAAILKEIRTQVWECIDSVIDGIAKGYPQTAKLKVVYGSAQLDAWVEEARTKMSQRLSYNAR